MSACGFSAANSFPPPTNTVKLEGAELVGFQTIIVGGIRDPFIIRRLDGWLEQVRGRIEASVAEILGLRKSDYRLNFHVYGRDAVMGALEPMRDAPAHEIGLVLEATARPRNSRPSLPS